MSLNDKLELYNIFWRGEGPSLILIPNREQLLYDMDDYPARFAEPELMWESELKRSEGFINWPTDGIPTIRPNLGVIFVPALAGQTYKVPEGTMPWPGRHLTRDEIRTVPETDLINSALWRKAEAFYRIHRESGLDEIVAYQPDTQGVFDIAHLLAGDELFINIADPNEQDWVAELMNISKELYIKASRMLKSAMNEPDDFMIHGHGTGQGAAFMGAGVRMSEDTATLLSPSMISEWIIPAVTAAETEFGGVFIHFCGQHKNLFEQLCRQECVKAIDLGNPEMYDTRWLMETCAATGTILYSRLPANPGETWQSYTERLGNLVNETGCRVILRPLVIPGTKDEAAAMLDLWHKLT